MPSTRTIARWTRLDEPGDDSARLHRTAGGGTVTGIATWRSPAGPAELAYEVRLAADWTTTQARVRGCIGDRQVDTFVERGAQGWVLNGRPQPQVDGTLDLDFAFTPATNLQQVRRLALPVGGQANLPVAWLQAGSDSLELLPQVYRRIGETEYVYEAPTVGYRATLVIPDGGFVTVYPGAWRGTLGE